MLWEPVTDHSSGSETGCEEARAVFRKRGEAIEFCVNDSIFVKELVGSSEVSAT